jgi:general secretion pathway protein B
MSYILDALKKSERERQRGAVPDLMTTQDVMAQAPKKRSFWPYLLVGALILNAGLLAWWLAWHSKKPPVAAQPIAARQQAAKAPDQANRSADAGLSVTAPPSETAKRGEPAGSSAEEKKTVYRPEIPAAKIDVPAVDVTRPSQQKQVNAGTQKNKENKPAPAREVNSPERVSSVPQQQTPAVKSSDTESVPAALSPVKNKLYGLGELPVSIRQSLPDFTISTHLYSSDASSRLVRINGQMLREGQFLSAGVKLEEITSDGMIFSYQGYRFRVALK